ncbi:MAG: phosphoglycerate kinase [Flavobacteriales bacterium]|nr:phosphoglycerate kinase [Flavobacteriales bacterium]
MHIDELDLQGKVALVRVDFNVPLKDGVVGDRNRIIAAVPTIEKLLDSGAKVVLMSHLGRPKGEVKAEFSLSQIVSAVSEELGREVAFVDQCVGQEVKEAIANLKENGVLLLENLRFHAEEEKGDRAFASQLAELGDVYVNDAFGTAHRAHASTAIIADFFKADERAFGYLIQNELEAVARLLQEPQRPFTAIMGGAKISDKILLIENILDKVDRLIIGGGMSYTFFKAKGGDVGNSLVEEDKLQLALDLLNKAEEKGVELHLPQDSIIADNFSNDANTSEADNMQIKSGWMGLDIGSKASREFAEVVESSKTILWNGPMGVFEMSKFAEGTKAMATAIANATENGAFSLIGGGDSAAAIRTFNFDDKVSYISTGGGALLEYLEGKELPGIKAIQS